MTRVRLSLLTALAAVVLLLSIAPAPARAQGPGGLYGDTLVIATTSALDPNPLNTSPENAVLHALVYDSLAVPSAATLVPAPWLATGWDVNRTAGSVTFHLRANAKFADGSALTADAVVASYQRYVTAGIVSGLSVSAPDPTTAVFTFIRGGGDFMGKWVALPIAYPGLSGPSKASGLFALPPSSPAGSLTITANANHWRGRPYLDAIRYEFHTGPSALDDAACALMENRVDYLGVPLTSDGLTAVRPCGGAILNLTNPSRFIASDPGFTFLHLGMNTQHVPLSDPAFRVAVTSALDRENIKLVEGAGSTEIADSPITPANGYWFNASVPKYRVVKGVEGGQVVTILDNVNDMLDRARYFDRNGDGWREAPDGTPFALRFLHESPTADPRFAKIDGIKTNLNAVGINLVDVQISRADILANVTADNFDLFLGPDEADPDPGFLFDMFHSSRLSGRNVNNVVNATLDAKLVSLRDELDNAMRQQVARDIQGWIGVNAAVAPLVHYSVSFSYRMGRFEGWVRVPGGIDNFWSFAGLHVIPKGPLAVSVVPSSNSIARGGTATVIVTVVDSADFAVKDVDVVLTGGSFGASSGKTGADGRFVTTFTAPSPSQTQDVTVRADVSKPGYDAASGAAAITVRVVPQRFFVSVERSKAILDPGGSAGVTVTVTDSTANPVPGASVTLQVEPMGVGGTLSATSGTTALNGSFFTTLTATVGTDTTFRITAVASGSGFISSSASTSVLARMRGGAPPNVGAVPGLDTVTMVIVVAAAAVLFSRWQARRRQR